MRYFVIVVMSILLTGCSYSKLFAHEMVPTYPIWMPASEAMGVYKTNLFIWNRRKDIEYYEVEVFDMSFRPQPFVTQDKIIKIGYLQRKLFTVYIKSENRENITYICTRSRLLKDSVQTSGVSSRICSKIK